MFYACKWSRGHRDWSRLWDRFRSFRYGKEIGVRMEGMLGLLLWEASREGHGRIRMWERVVWRCFDFRWDIDFVWESDVSMRLL